MTGTLFLVPNLLGAVPPASVLPARTIGIARNLSHWLVETPKPARAFLKSIAVARPVAELAIRALSDDPPADARFALGALASGHDVGLLSDAGCPGVADPGAAIVAAAHAARVRVVPLVGPSAVLLALMASGMNGQGFAFHGYLPVKTDARAAAIRLLEDASRHSGHAQIFIETPYRNAAMLAALVETCKVSTRLCVAADLTLPTESVVSKSVREWRSADGALYARRPAIFILQA